MAVSDTALTKELNDSLYTKAGTRSIKYMDTAAAYDLWSEVYDTDGNFLQALDNFEMDTLLPRTISVLRSSYPPTFSTSNDMAEGGFKVIDLGCGTGRNTVKLLDFPEVREIVAVDLSPKMLEIARQRCHQKLESTGSSRSQPQPNLTFSTYDMINTTMPPPPLTTPKLADLVISTLVLEHIPLTIFFSTVSRLLGPGGFLLLTNMHSDMGKISQAGFVDPRTGEKIRPTSYAHEVGDVLREAGRWGLEVVVNGRRDNEDEGENHEAVEDMDSSGVKEVRMGREMMETLGGRSEKWIGVEVWFGGLWRKTETTVDG